MFRLTPYNNRQVLKREGREVNDFYNMIDSFFDESFWPIRNLQRDTFKIDVKDQENNYLIEADLPGVEKDDVKLEFSKGVLSISVERNEEKNKEEENYIHRERRCSSMMRSMQLRDIDESTIEAKLENGVLTIKAEKLKEEKNQKYIEIK
ncbi:MAG: Hsp20 family protein [Clostridia bacterium]|nr:Hsp20 family protein [Clostridia bacterium]